MGKASFLIGLGAGYVLGAKAGTQRYEQLSRLYDNVTASPAFRKATGRAKEAASTGLEQARDLATDGVSKVTEAVRERRAGDDYPTGLSVAPPPAH
jgi:uncharacterized protein YgiB involved in biofilm formation